jgi:GntR family transcriptional repressor for pyruvate dehydrogenase complex
MSDDVPLSLAPVERTPRLSDLVSDRLLSAVRDAHLPAGAKLPSERELAEQFGVSRTVIREAVRDLAAKGVLDVRSGAGARVARLDGATVGQSLVLFLRRRGLLDPGKIHEVRETLELQTTRLAALRGTDEDLAAIQQAYIWMSQVKDEPEQVSEADVEFHRAIARAAENELYLVLVDSLGDVLMEIRRATLARPGRADAAIAQHGRVVDALLRRDVEGAVDAMREHLADSLHAFRDAVDG